MLEFTLHLNYQSLWRCNMEYIFVQKLAAYLTFSLFPGFRAIC
jgi:hypothetical protein